VSVCSFACLLSASLDYCVASLQPVDGQDGVFAKEPRDPTDQLYQTANMQEVNGLQTVNTYLQYTHAHVNTIIH